MNDAESLAREKHAKEVLATLAELENIKRGRKLFDCYSVVSDDLKVPGAYSWQAEFHNAGSEYTERAIFAGNRCGKTSAAAAEMAMHLTGEYPTWWMGKRFEEEIQAWVGGETNESVRDVIQEQLLGPEGAHGTGWIPVSRLAAKPRYRQAGVNNVVDQIFVKHVSGGISTLTQKTYEQGVDKWRGKRLDVVWLDEEPEENIWTESRTRILDRKGIIYITFTPHKGRTQVVNHFLDGKRENGIFYKNVTWEDAPHLDAKAKEELWNSYPEHERKTRAQGVPHMGRGAIFPLDLSHIIVDPLEIPRWWARINGCDFGIDHPFGFAACAIDRDSDTFYVYDTYKAKGETPAIHAVAMKKHGGWIPIAWPRDGLQRDKGSGQQLRDMYRANGLSMTKDHAHYRDERGEHVEPGLLEMYEYMKAGKFKVFRSLGEPFLEEARNYHRDEDGKIVKLNDDVISAARYAFMMRRFARTPPSSTPVGTPPPSAPISG